MDRGREGPRAVVELQRDPVELLVGDREVRSGLLVELADRDGHRLARVDRGHRRGQEPHPLIPVNRDGAGVDACAAVGDGEVEQAVPVEVGAGDRVGRGARRFEAHVPEGARTEVHQGPHAPRERVRDGEVDEAVGVEVPERHGPRAALHRVRLEGAEGPVPLVEANGDVVGLEPVGEREVGRAVAVDVPDGHVPGVAPGQVRDGSRERSAARPQQDDGSPDFDLAHHHDVGRAAGVEVGDAQDEGAGHGRERRHRAEGPAAGVEEDPDAPGLLEHGDQVERAVAVDVGEGRTARVPRRGVGLLGRERPVPVVFEHRDRLAEAARDRDVGVPVSVHVAEGRLGRAVVRGVGDRRREGPVALVDQHDDGRRVAAVDHDVGARVAVQVGGDRGVQRREVDRHGVQHLGLVRPRPASDQDRDRVDVRNGRDQVEDPVTVEVGHLDRRRPSAARAARGREARGGEQRRVAGGPDLRERRGGQERREQDEREGAGGSHGDRLSSRTSRGPGPRPRS